jgi:Fe-S-cluster containining protein
MSNPSQLKSLERQVERGNLHAHTALGACSSRLSETQAMLHGLADVLLTKGIIDAEELTQAMRSVENELKDLGDSNGPGLLVRIEPDVLAKEQEPVVDCAERMPICKAVCCRLDFALSIREIEGGHARWDLGRPYFIRREKDGNCSHRCGSGCNIYAQRPQVCRRYSCEHDERIWKDFANKQLNTEWIEQNLGDQPGPRATHAHMHAPVEVSKRPSS